MSEITKKRRVSPAADDRISALPDDILHHILSFLEIKQIISTTVLSKRWRPLWTSAPTVDLGAWFPPPYATVNNVEAIPDLITKSLLLYDGARIRRFRARFDYQIASVTDTLIQSWVRFATGRNVQELEVNLCGIWESKYDTITKMVRRCQMDGSLLECASLEVLSLSSFQLDLRSQLRLHSLKKLELSHVSVSDLDTSCCPVLECLILKDCNTTGHLNINAPNRNLVYVKIDDVFQVVAHDTGVTLFAPNLLSIEFSGHIRRAYKVKDLSSLRTVHLDFTSFGGRGYKLEDTLSLLDLLGYVSKASTLIFSQWCIQILSRWDAKEMKLPQFSATCLKMEFSLNETILIGMASVLRSTSSLESLILHTGASPIQTETWDSFFYRDFVDPWAALECSLSAIQRLKTIEINNFLPSKPYLLDKKPDANLIDRFLEKWKKEFKLAQLFLNSFTTLEKMIICSTIPASWALKSDFLFGLKRKLISFPKASTNARIYFVESSHTARASPDAEISFFAPICCAVFEAKVGGS